MPARQPILAPGIQKWTPGMHAWARQGFSATNQTGQPHKTQQALAKLDSTSSLDLSLRNKLDRKFGTALLAPAGS
jgi:hypothetical protein